MMNFTPRAQKILALMLREEDNPLSKQEIADRIGVSKRTVQREFDYLDSDLAEYHIKVENKKGKGVRLAGSPEDLERLRDDITQIREPDPGNIAERRRHLLYELLKDRTPRKLYYYADLLRVSEATIGSDMESLQPWLLKNDLHIIRRQGYGVILSGSEKDYREAMRRFISDNTGEKWQDGAAQAVLDGSSKDIYSLLDTDIVGRVKRVLDKMRQKEPRLSHMADSAFSGLIIHISISIERIRQDADVTLSGDTARNLASWPEYGLAREILHAMEQEFDISIPETEIAYILLHIRGSRIAYSDETLNSDDPELEDERLLPVIDKMIDAYDPENAVAYRMDETFIRGLLVHLRPAIVRLRGHMNIINPVLDDIRSEYPDVYERTVKAAAVLSKALGTPVSDEETGFLAMHFGAAQERISGPKTPAKRRVEIGVVCASGFGVARLMLTKLADSLRESANLKAYGKQEITDYVSANTDFFVSTMDLDEMGVDYVRVSPMITAQDLEKIQYKIDDYAILHRDRPQKEEQDFARQLGEANFMTREIKGIIERYDRIAVRSGISFRDLLWTMAMHISGNIEGSRMIVEGVMRREAMNTQVFPDLGIALLHCRTGAVRDAIFITCSPSDKTAFTDQKLAGIQAAVMMLMPEDDDQNRHREVLGRISGAFVNNTSFLNAVKSGTKEEIRRELTSELRQYFYEFLGRL